MSFKQQSRACTGLFPSFVIVDNGFENVKGIDVDIARDLQKRTGFKLKNNRFDIMNFGELIDLATIGQIDIAGGGITLSH